MDRRAALDLIRTTLAADCACRPEDWQRDTVTLVEWREMAGRRRFPLREAEFTIKTMGRGAVISCHANYLAWAREQLAACSKDDLFSIATWAQIMKHLASDGVKLVGPTLNFTCTDEDFRAASVPAGFMLEEFAQDRMAEAYAHLGFDHALSYDFNYPRPDVVAVAAWHAGKVVGMAGASADSEDVWQVGITVLPQVHRMGVGKALVSRATEIVLEHGKVPHYSTWVANLASSNTARSVGYWLAWTDVYVRDL